MLDAPGNKEAKQMNTKDLYQAALKAGGLEGVSVPALERFANLVVEAERDRLSRECAQLPFGDTAASFAVWIKNGGKA